MCLVTSPNCLSNWGFHLDCVTSHHKSPRGDQNLVFVVGLSPRAADVVPLASLNSPTSLSPVLFVMGEWNYIKHKTDHFDANLLMNLKESH